MFEFLRIKDRRTPFAHFPARPFHALPIPPFCKCESYTELQKDLALSPVVWDWNGSSHFSSSILTSRTRLSRSRVSPPVIHVSGRSPVTSFVILVGFLISSSFANCFRVLNNYTKKEKSTLIMIWNKWKVTDLQEERRANAEAVVLIAHVKQTSKAWWITDFPLTHIFDFWF